MSSTEIREMPDVCRCDGSDDDVHLCTEEMR
jgi:hypothetical protein